MAVCNLHGFACWVRDFSVHFFPISISNSHHFNFSTLHNYSTPIGCASFQLFSHGFMYILSCIFSLSLHPMNVSCENRSKRNYTQLISICTTLTPHFVLHTHFSVVFLLVLWFSSFWSLLFTFLSFLSPYSLLSHFGFLLL